MRKNKFVRLTAFLLLAIMLMPTFTSCKDKGEPGADYISKYDQAHQKQPDEYYIKFTDDSETEIYVPDGVSLDDPEIYDLVKDQWRELILGDLNEDGEHGDAYEARVEAISAACKSAYDRAPTFGYKGINSSAGVLDGATKIQAIYGYIYDMALGYGTVGSEYYHDEQLARAIENALEYAYTNYYGPNILDPDDDPTLFVWNLNEGSGNWWQRDVGIPLSLMPTLLIMEEYLGADSVERYLEPFDKLNPYPHMTMANRLWIGKSVLISAFLQEDAERILKSKNDLLELFVYMDKIDRANLSGDSKTDGFYSDGSFIQHGGIPYTSGYGMSTIEMITDIMMALRGTRFEYYEEEADMQYEWMLNSYVPLNYEGKMFSAMSGRNVTRSGFAESSNNVGIVVYMLKMSTYAPANIRSQLLSIVRYNLTSSNNNYGEKMPLCLLEYMEKVKNDSTIAPTGYIGAKVYGDMDRIVQQNSEYAVCVSLNSTRIYRYESLNEDNNQGWYQSDGSIFIYTDGYTFSSNFYNRSDPYKLPGITVTDAFRQPQLTEPRQYNYSSFSGGVTSSDGKYAMSVYELKYNKGIEGTDLKANKTYFIFDNEIVAVGSGITEGSNNTTNTIIDNRFWRSGDKFTINGSEASLSNYNAIVKNMHFTNMGGYVFFEDTKVEYNKTSESYLELWIEHGKKPSKAQYAYVYLPEATVAETTSYSANPDVQILTQTDNVHVVKETKLGITGYAFYFAGSANGVSVSSRCALMVQEKNGEYIVTVSDPSQELSTLNVTLELPVSQVVSKDEAASVEFKDGKAVISLNINGNNGGTYAITLK